MMLIRASCISKLFNVYPVYNVVSRAANSFSNLPTPQMHLWTLINTTLLDVLNNKATGPSQAQADADPPV
jgi:hypothetical protein